MGKDKAMVLFSGTMEKNLKEIGKKVSKVDLVFGDHLKEIIMKVNGKTIDKKVKDYLGINLVLIEASL